MTIYTCVKCGNEWSTNAPPDPRIKYHCPRPKCGGTKVKITTK